MSAQIECPICMDCIEMNKNCITTDCGHSFHANCLMTSVAHNGFGCPYCRTAMAEAPDDDESTEYESNDGEEAEAEDMFDDNALRGFRFFFDNLNGQAHEAEDIEEENEMADENDDGAEEEAPPNVPTTDFVAQRLREQGVTFEQLVRAVCFSNHDEYSYDEEGDRLDDWIFGKIRIIVSNYQPEQAPAPVEAPAPVVMPVDAQPKTQEQVRNPRIMMHV